MVLDWVLPPTTWPATAPITAPVAAPRCSGVMVSQPAKANRPLRVAAVIHTR